MQKQVEQHEKELRYNCNSCLIGSIMLTIGKLAGKRDKDVYKDFENILNKLPKQDEWSIYSLCEYFCSYYRLRDEYKKRLILCYDKQNVMSPLVTLITEDRETGKDKIWPISSDGEYTGILAKPERLQYELIYS